jgi:hypothetical protein
VVLDDDNSLPNNVAQEPGDDKAEDGGSAMPKSISSAAPCRQRLGSARGSSRGRDDSDQIDEAWVYLDGGFGEFRIGSEDEALALACLLPPGGTANFSAFSPNQWGANAFSPISNSACTGVDEVSDAQKILYISPSSAAFSCPPRIRPIRIRNVMAMRRRIPACRRRFRHRRS